MDKIAIDGIKAHGRHGVFSEEHKLGQPFIVDISLFLDLTMAGKSDDLADSVNYAEIYYMVLDEIQHKSYKLIEKLAYSIICRCLAFDKRIEKIHVTVKKPQAPLFGEFDVAKVEMERMRGECDLS